MDNQIAVSPDVHKIKENKYSPAYCRKEREGMSDSPLANCSIEKENDGGLL